MKCFISLFCCLFCCLFLLGCSAKEQLSFLQTLNPLVKAGSETLCIKNKECKKKCEGLFLEWESKEACFKKPFSLVQKMYTLAKILKKPNEDNLIKINLNTLQSMLSISEKTWLVRINDYSKREARLVLFWLASKPKQDIFSYRESSRPIRLILVALLRQNARTSLWDDNALLSGLKEPITEKGKHFFEVANQKNNIRLMSRIHETVVIDQLCDYPINQPKPAFRFFNSEYRDLACELAVYCYITGSYIAGQYIPKKRAKALRKDIAGELELENIESFIEANYEEGGLNIIDNPDELTDMACKKLSNMWNDGNLKFGL